MFSSSSLLCNGGNFELEIFHQEHKNSQLRMCFLPCTILFYFFHQIHLFLFRLYDRFLLVIIDFQENLYKLCKNMQWYFFLNFTFFFKLSFRQGNFSPCTGCPTFNIITGVDFNFGELCLTTQTPYCTSNNVTSSTTSLGQRTTEKGCIVPWPGGPQVPEISYDSEKYSLLSGQSLPVPFQQPSQRIS